MQIVEPISLSWGNWKENHIRRGSKEVPKMVLFQVFEFEFALDPESPVPVHFQSEAEIIAYLLKRSVDAGRPGKDLTLSNLDWHWSHGHFGRQKLVLPDPLGLAGNPPGPFGDFK